MLLTYTPLTLHLRNPFRLSYGTSETRQVFWIRLAEDEGWGEAAIPPYYGVDPAAMTACWDLAARSARPLPEQIEDIPAWVGLDGPAPARCALDLALYDRIGRKQGLPLYRLLGLPKPPPLSTCFTIAIDTPAEMARMAQEAARFPAIKVKLGGQGDDEGPTDFAGPGAGDVSTVGSDGTVRVWDLRSRIPVLRVPVANIYSLAIAGRDRLVVSAQFGLLVIEINDLAPPANGSGV